MERDSLVISSSLKKNQGNLFLKTSNDSSLDKDTVPRSATAISESSDENTDFSANFQNLSPDNQPKIITKDKSKYKSAMSAMKALGSVMFSKDRQHSHNQEILQDPFVSSLTNNKRENRMSIHRENRMSMNSNTSGHDIPVDFALEAMQTFSLYPSETQVNVKWQDTSINIKIADSNKIPAVIAQICRNEKISQKYGNIEINSPDQLSPLSLSTMAKLSQSLLSISENDIRKSLSSEVPIGAADAAMPVNLNRQEDFMLGKKDRQNPGMRVWFNPKAPISMYSLKQGDELILKHLGELEVLQFVIPPLEIKNEIKFDHELSVLDCIKDIKKSRELGDIAYGFYNPQKGMWLDGTKRLIAYDLSDQILQFRALSNEFLVRVSIPELNQKIGIKVLPTFLASDVISIITFQLINRKLKLQKEGQYGIFIPSNNQWLHETARMDSIDIIKTETVEFKLQYGLCNLKSLNGQQIQVLIDNKCKVGQLLDLFTINYSLPLDQDYAIAARGGALLPKDQIMMDIVNDMTANESLLIQMEPTKIIICTPAYPNLNLNYDIDLSRTFASYLPSILRKLGYPFESFLNVHTVQSMTNLDITIPISKLKLPQPIQIVIHCKPSNTPASLPKNESKTKMSGLQLESIDDLIQKLTDPSNEQSTTEFMKTFLLTYKKFISAQDLIRILSSRYSVFNETGMTWPNFENYRKPIELRVANILLHWVKKFPFDFTGSAIGQENCNVLLNMIEEKIEREHPNLAKLIRKNIQNLNEPKPDNDLALKYAKDELSEEAASNTLILNYPSQEIAEQLTFIEKSLYIAINPPELLNQAWSKKDANVTAPGIVAISRRFNAVASWTVQCILDQKTAKLRAQRITKLIEVAGCLISLNNYSTLMALIAGMNKACISRLRETEKEIPSKSLKKKTEIETLMSANGSYKNYRASIHSIQPPCIPYIGTYLTDLTYAEDGNPDNIDGLINFTKVELIAKVIREILEFQQAPYNIKPNQEMCSILCHLPETNAAQEKVFWQLSKKYES